ncbi:uncharacterized protein LOC144090963 [Stigmatopora argus]
MMPWRPDVTPLARWDVCPTFTAHLVMDVVLDPKLSGNWKWAESVPFNNNSVLFKDTRSLRDKGGSKGQLSPDSVWNPAKFRGGQQLTKKDKKDVKSLFGLTSIIVKVGQRSFKIGQSDDVP